ncbi:hypothetical protein F8388_002457 [Cannabis sativa]|uniref:Nuclear pore complex protein NUP1 n=1 Tax=Cannabis sativa TaxID=3483 RepID=A0A7J6E6M6_CANSA|nr:hypothetical protein F8388_002457 [Cannabis sativa]
MATGREQQQQQPYEGGGLGAGGKFRKKPFRKTTHSTPYDRPPTVFRNPNNGGGWLSKLVDPAHRLISSSAHRLFSTVFRKRITQPQPQPQPPSSPLRPEANCEARNTQQETVATDSSGAQKGAIDQSDGPSNNSSREELTELEQILQQKTFTRQRLISEIDHLTALLHSRTVGLAVENKEKKPEVIPLKEVGSADRQEAFTTTSVRGNMIESEGLPKTTLLENMTGSQFVSTPVVNSTVLEGDATSPTDVVELAKSYMHKRPISPLMSGFQSQAGKENSSAMYTRNLTSPMKLPVTPLVPRTSGHVEARENGFITPRSRGRSAIYSMARTPYSRIYQTTSLKNVENAVDVYTGPSSSSQVAPDQNLLSRSKQGSSKRRSSVLDNDIGSYGAIRKIRQKPNLLSPRGLSLPVSGSPFGSAGSQNSSSSALKPSFGEPRRNFFKPSTDNGENVVSNTTVPFKSSEMASKILQQIDKLVSPKEKSSQSKVHASMDKLPSKLSPSMLRGQALKSLDDVDSSKIFSGIQNNKSLDNSHDMRIPDAQEFTSQRLDKAKENGFKHDFPYGQSTSKMNDRVCTASEVNGANSIVPRKDSVPSSVTSVPAALNSAAYPQHKRKTFRMSAHEDFVDLDDDIHSNGCTSNSLGEGRVKENSSLIERTSIATEDAIPEKTSALTESKPAGPEFNKKTDKGTLAGSMTAEKSANIVLPSTSPCTTAPPADSKAVPFLITDGAAPLMESNVSTSMFNFGGKIASSRDTDAAAPSFNFGLKSADKVSNSPFLFSSSSASGSENVNFGVASDSKPATSSNLSTTATGAIDSVPMSPEADKNNLNVGVSFRTPETALPSAASSSSANIFAFGTTPRDGLNNGFSASISSTPVVSSTSQNTSNGSLFGNSTSNVPTPSTTTFGTGSGSLSTSTPAPAVPVSPFGSSKASSLVAPVTENSSVPAPSVFKFGSSTDSTAVAPASETSSIPVSPATKFGYTSTGVAQVSETSSVPAASVFKFSTASPAAPPVSGSSFDVTCGAIKTELVSSVGNESSAGVGATPSTNASSGSTLFGISAAATSSTSTTQSLGLSFGAGISSVPSSQASPTGTGLATFSQSNPFQFGSSSGSSPIFGLSGSTTFSSGSSPFGSTTSIKPFSSGSTPGLGSSSSEANLVSSSSTSTPSVFGSSWQPSKSPPVFNFNSTPSTFAFGATSAASTTTNSSPSIFGASTPAATNGAPGMFASSNGASSSSPFLFNSSSGPASTQTVFGNASPTFAFGASAGHNDQMSMEDSMAEDTVQASAPAVPGFGQQNVTPAPSAFAFASAPAPSVVNPFQFGGQPNPSNPQNPSPFQAPGNLGLMADGSNFSLGSGGSGVDKSNRKYIKVKSKQRKK